MKKLFYFAVSALILCCTSCKDDDNEDKYKTYQVTVQLGYPAESGYAPVEGVEIKLTNTGGSVFDAVTDNTGKAGFTVPAGVYEASATDVRYGTGESFIYSGIKSGIAVTETWVETQIVQLSLSESKKGQVVIKELYNGGCKRDDGSGNFQTDKYVILYNNSDLPASLDNLCLGMVLPYNAQATNNDYVDGVLSYEAEGWIPAGNGIWYFPENVTLDPGKQIVIALNGAIDHTATYTNSVNLGRAEYYCTYDITQYDNISYYPSPSEVIPTSHYLSAVKYGPGNAWALSTTSPAFFLFTTKEVSPVDFANDADNTNYHGNTVTAANMRKKVRVEWIIDAVEVFTTTSDNNRKRLTAAVDAGQTYLANTFGYTSYRNVDADATKAIEGNEAKLVYNYDKGTEIDGRASSDPSGIDAEASIRNGARIIYKDTNNSTNDFHQRKQASLRD
ncbi:MAG: DUF4876 domain-containing protein [Tannerella sp.]|jgi:hypothetical protein|nr:DUF4876 domain-containing protein [Tannerella sp.]